MEEDRSPTRSSGRISSASDSLIKQWLIKFGALYTPTQIMPSALPALWGEALRDISCETLAAAFQRVSREFVPTAACPFPTPAHVRGLIMTATGAKESFEGEEAWKTALRLAEDFGCDYPIVSAEQCTDEAINAGIRAAGGARHIYLCTDAERVWAKKTFLDIWRKHRQMPGLRPLLAGETLPEIKKLAAEKGLPE